MDSSKNDFQRLFAIGLILSACLVRIAVCLQHNPMDYLFSDMLRHWGNGIHFPRGGYQGASDPIVYQVYIAALRRLTHDSRVIVALAAALLSVSMPWTYYRAARNFGLPKKYALWAWALIAWTPSLLTIYHYIMMETMLLFLEGLSLWMTARYLRKGGSEAFLTSIAAWTLTALTKPTIVPLAVICVLWSWWKRSTPLRTIAVAILVAIVLLIPQSIRAKKELGFFAPFGNPWLTRIQHRSGVKVLHLNYHGPFHDEDGQWYASPTCFIRPLWPLSSWTIRRGLGESTFTITADYRHGSTDWRNAYESLDTEWDEWMAQWRENIIVSLFAPSWPETTSQQWDSRLDFYSRWIWAPLILLVVAFDVKRFLQGRLDLLPVAVTVFTLALVLQNVVTAEGRYRKPIEPLLILNLVWLIRSWRERPLLNNGTSEPTS